MNVEATQDKLLALQRANERARRVVVAVCVLAAVFGIGVGCVAAWAGLQARNVAQRIDDCLVVGGGCYEELARNGLLGSNRLMDFTGCYLEVLPENRNPKERERCKKEADDRFFQAVKEDAPE